jgi:hypothetical protein
MNTCRRYGPRKLICIFHFHQELLVLGLKLLVLSTSGLILLV